MMIGMCLGNRYCSAAVFVFVVMETKSKILICDRRRERENYSEKMHIVLLTICTLPLILEPFEKKN